MEKLMEKRKGEERCGRLEHGQGKVKGVEDTKHRKGSGLRWMGMVDSRRRGMWRLVEVTCRQGRKQRQKEWQRELKREREK